MFSVNGGVETGFVNVVASNNGGLSNDQISEMATYHIELARREERATIAHKLREAGHHDLADTIRRM